MFFDDAIVEDGMKNDINMGNCCASAHRGLLGAREGADAARTIQVEWTRTDRVMRLTLVAPTSATVALPRGGERTVVDGRRLIRQGGKTKVALGRAGTS